MSCGQEIPGSLVRYCYLVHVCLLAPRLNGEVLRFPCLLLGVNVKQFLSSAPLVISNRKNRVRTVMSLFFLPLTAWPMVSKAAEGKQEDRKIHRQHDDINFL